MECDQNEEWERFVLDSSGRHDSGSFSQNPFSMHIFSNKVNKRVGIDACYIICR